jgi:hypothetical protein
VSDPIPCPCCRQPVLAPTVEIVIDHLRIPPHQARILGAIWNGKGRPVQTAMILAAMDQGTDRQPRYEDFKTALHHLRKRLKAVGIEIPNMGYAQGYYLKLPSKGQPHV